MSLAGTQAAPEGYANQPPFRLSSMSQTPQITKDDLPQFVTKIVEEADRDKTEYMPDRRVAPRPTFMQAVQGIENGDYEGLEMLEFGAVADGTPAVSFTDEDGQRQVIRLTVPQWFGALESRSRARSQFRQLQDLENRKQAFAPYFDAMTKQVTEASDPDIGGYLRAMYQMNPQAAIEQIGGFIKNRNDRTIWRGKPVPPQFAQASQQAFDMVYQGKMRQYDAMARGLQDKPYGLAMLEGIRALNRTPADVVQPTSTTLIDNLRSQGGGMMPLVNLVQAMKTPGMVPFMPQPIILPRPTQDGQYNPDEMLSFLDQFNQVSENLGWGHVLAVDEGGIAMLVEALNVANKTDGVLPRLPASAQVVPATVQREQMRQAERAGMQPSTGGGGGGDEVIMAGATALGMADKSPEEIVDKILSIEEAIKYRTEQNDWRDFPYDAAQREAIMRAADELRARTQQER